MSARQLKEELSRDQISRKLDSTYERLNHRLGYLEARLDVSVAKLQVIIKNILLHTCRQTLQCQYTTETLFLTILRSSKFKLGFLLTHSTT
jgi:hypothetical protein